MPRHHPDLILGRSSAMSGLAELQSIFSTTSRFGQLLNVKVSYAGRNAYPRFKCATGDAMGMNMVGKGVNTAVAELLRRFDGSALLALSGNYCTDKKPSAVNAKGVDHPNLKLKQREHKGALRVCYVARGGARGAGQSPGQGSGWGLKW